MTSVRHKLAARCVGVESKQGLGSGVVTMATDVGSDVLTCFHVVNKRPKAIYVVWRTTGGYYRKARADIVAEDAENDLALLRTRKPLPVPEIELADAEPTLFDTVWTCSCPGPYFAVTTSGTVQGLQGFIRNRIYGNRYLLSGIFSAGSSGGMITDAQGSLVGILAEALSEDEQTSGLGQAVPLPAIRNFLQGGVR